MEQNLPSNIDQSQHLNRRFIKYSVIPVVASIAIGVTDFIDTGDVGLGIAYLIGILLPILVAIRICLAIQSSMHPWQATLLICVVIGIALFFTMLILSELIAECGNGYKCLGLGALMYGGLFYFGFITIILTLKKWYGQKS